MRFIFWNIRKAAIHDRVAQLVIDRDIDVVVLAEARDQIPHISSSLSSLSNTSFYTFDSIGCERINIIAKFPPNMASICYETPNFTILHFSLPGLDSFLLVAVHLPSKIWANPMDQAGQCEDLAEIIVEAENRIGHTRTMLLGDINQNPFEEGVISAKGLHAVMSINIARKETRKFYKKNIDFFTIRCGVYLAILKVGHLVLFFMKLAINANFSGICLIKCLYVLHCSIGFNNKALKSLRAIAKGRFLI
jgi:hypothetical protein